MKFRPIGYFIVLALACVVAAHASTVQFELDQFPGTLGTSQMYTAGPFTITAFGFDGSGTPTNLYGKNTGGGGGRFGTG